MSICRFHLLQRAILQVRLSYFIVMLISFLTLHQRWVHSKLRKQFVI
jgi:hypothetical protein